MIEDAEAPLRQIARRLRGLPDHGEDDQVPRHLPGATRHNLAGNQTWIYS
jgi:hypothetical protein